MILPTNIWPVLVWRRARNWLLYQKMIHGWSQALLDEKRHIVSRNWDIKTLHPSERRRLEHCNFWLGNEYFFTGKLSPAEHLRRKRMVEEIIAEIKAEEAELETCC